MPDLRNISAGARPARLVYPARGWRPVLFLLLTLVLGVGSAVAQSPTPQDLPATSAEEPPGALDQVDEDGAAEAPTIPAEAAGPESPDDPADPASAPDAPEPPEPVEIDDTTPWVNTGERVMIFEDLEIEVNESAREVVVILGSLELDGRAHEVVVVGGSARVDGEVDREIVVVGGSLYLGPESRVGRDVVVVGGRLDRAPGSEVGGAVNRVNAGPFLSEVDWDNFDVDVDWGPARRIWSYPVRVFWHLMKLAVLALLVCFVYMVAPRAVERVERPVAAEPLKAGLIGLAISLLLLPLTVLFLIATFCLGILALPFLALGLVLVLLVGYTAVALRLGRWLRGRGTQVNLTSPYAAIVAGLVLIEGWELLSVLLDIGWLGFFAAMIGIVAAVVEVVAWLVGLGAVVMSWMEQRRTGPAPLPPPAVPPPPGAPYPGSPRATATPAYPEEDDWLEAGSPPPAPPFPSASDPVPPTPVTPVTPVAPVTPVTPETAYVPDPEPAVPDDGPGEPRDDRGLPGEPRPPER